MLHRVELSKASHLELICTFLDQHVRRTDILVHYAQLVHSVEGKSNLSEEIEAPFFGKGLYF